VIRQWSILVLAVVMSGCASGHSASELRDTPVGKMPPPRGSVLAVEYYTPAAFGIDGPLCAHLERTYVSNDARAFLEAMRPILQSHHAKYVFIPNYPVFHDDIRGHLADVSADTIDGTRIQVDFHDVDDAAYHAPSWLDTSAWRFVIDVRIWDTDEGEGGGCDESVF
jgi:hypothetical protein